PSDCPQLSPDGPWPYPVPSGMTTHRNSALPESGEDGKKPDIRFAQGPVADHYVEMCTATGDHDLWVMGGGDLAGQFADEGFLDEIITYTAPVVLGKGRPLLPRRLDLELIEVGHSDPFVIARHRVIGPLLEDSLESLTRAVPAPRRPHHPYATSVLLGDARHPQPRRRRGGPAVP